MPADDPAPDLFLEPRLLHAEEEEGLWLRVVDVPAALESRGWDVGGAELTLFVHGDKFVPENNGSWCLAVGNAPTCTPRAKRLAIMAEDCDIQLGIGALSALFMVRNGVHSGALVNCFPVDCGFKACFELIRRAIEPQQRWRWLGWLWVSRKHCGRWITCSQLRPNRIAATTFDSKARFFSLRPRSSNGPL